MISEKIYPSRYDYGVKTINHKGVNVTTSINTDVEKLLARIPTDINYLVGNCASFVVHRPDVISNLFYNTPELWWYVQLFNNINDPFEGFNGGDRLLIPNESGLKFGEGIE